MNIRIWLLPAVAAFCLLAAILPVSARNVQVPQPDRARINRLLSRSNPTFESAPGHGKGTHSARQGRKNLVASGNPAELAWCDLRPQPSRQGQADGTQFINIRLEGLALGAFNSGQRQFNGVIDDVRIYNRTLNQSELDFLAAHPPTLMIAPAGPKLAKVSWTPAATNWVLQESTSLSPAAWTNSPSAFTNPIVVPATVPAKFYWLFKP